jgi:NAD(P)-dependent dehydrogenase (short-subunit alcohol dehydrogenase family)
MNEQSTQSTPRVALVTGGAKRLGRAIALALAADGWDLAIHYGASADDARATCAEIEALGRRAQCFQADLRDEASVRALLPRAALALGGVACVVNNASLFEFDNAISLNQATLDTHMRINVAAPVILAQALYDGLPAGAAGVVVNLLDQKLYNPNPDFLSYTLSKAALASATTLLAQALAPRVRVVGVAPGLTLISHIQTPEQFAQAHRISPLGESSRPEEVASAVAFACANRALTGTTIVVDAGQHLLPLQRDFSLIEGKS